MRYLILTLFLFLLIPMTANAFLLERRITPVVSGSACDPISGASVDLSFGCSASYSGSGSAVTDLAGSADFTIQGNPTFSTDHLVFDGTGDYLTADTIPAAALDIHASTGGDFLLGMVVRTEATVTSSHYLWAFYESGTEYFRTFIYGTDVDQVRLLHDSGSTNYTADSTSTTTGATIYCIIIAVDKSAGDTKFFINSTTEEVVDGTFAYGGTQTGITAIDIGGNGTGVPNPPNGSRLYEALNMYDTDYATVDATFVGNIFADWEARHAGLDCTP